MIAVDTSVWVAALRRADSPEAAVLSALLDDDAVLLPYPVRLEILSGASPRNLGRLRRSLAALPVAYPSDETWRAIEPMLERAAHAGERFGLRDVLIAALADEQGALVWSLDTDFARLERLGLARCYVPPRMEAARSRR